MCRGHIAAAAELRTPFASAGFAFTDQFATSVIQLIGTAVDMNGSFCSIDDRPSAGLSIGAVAVSAFSIPFDGFVPVKLEGGVHGIIHGPSIIRPMVFSRIYDHFIGEVGL